VHFLDGLDVVGQRTGLGVVHTVEKVVPSIDQLFSFTRLPANRVTLLPTSPCKPGERFRKAHNERELVGMVVITMLSLVSVMRDVSVSISVAPPSPPPRFPPCHFHLGVHAPHVARRQNNVVYDEGLKPAASIRTV